MDTHGLPSAFHGFTITHGWPPMSLPWVCSGSVWVSHGSPMGHPWATHVGSPMMGRLYVSRWYTAALHGPPMRLPWVFINSGAPEITHGSPVGLPFVYIVVSWVPHGSPEGLR